MSAVTAWVWDARTRRDYRYPTGMAGVVVGKLGAKAARETYAKLRRDGHSINTARGLVCRLLAAQGEMISAGERT